MTWQIHYAKEKVSPEIPMKGSWRVIWPDGSVVFVVDGQLHNEEGPAVIWPNGFGQYYLSDSGGPMSECAWERGIRELRARRIKELVV